MHTQRVTPGWTSERGIALVTVMLVLLLSSAVLAGFLASTSTDQKLRAVDRSRTQAFYAAHAGLEKLTADLGDLFAGDFSPESADLDVITGETPTLPNVEFFAADGKGYTIEFTDESPVGAPDGEPDTAVRTVESGPFQGFRALMTEYYLWTTARMIDGSEARLRRKLQTVSIPVFQFGIFSDMDLSFFAGPVFNFGGRVHTNGSLYLASGSTLTLADRVSAFREIIRTNLANGWGVGGGYTGEVRPTVSAGSTRPLEVSEGSLTGTVGSAANPSWTNVSLTTYNANLRTALTGAKNLQLPLVALGGESIDLIRRPVVGEPVAMTNSRLFAQANIRILLSNTTAAINNLPTVSAPAPVALGRLDDPPAAGTGPIAGYNHNLVFNERLAVSAGPGPAAAGYRSPTNTPLLGGYLKVEYRDVNDVWNDVTVEWLNLGFTQRNMEVAGCQILPSPSQDAIIRLQRIKTVPSTGAGFPFACASTIDTDLWPLTLYDTREGTSRDTEPVAGGNIYLGGVMHYIELDVNNLRRWLLDQIGASGDLVSNEDGYTIYFSDRRTNLNALGNETGEYGFEDVVNRASPSGAADGGLETGEDFNGDGALQAYGATPIRPPGSSAPFNPAANPRTVLTPNEAKVNRAVLFRRALKIVNGAVGELPADGINITAENPVYVVGPFNATNAAFAANYAPAAIIADAVTLLSPNWTDANSFVNPNNPGARPRTNTYYRFALIGGKGISFERAGTNCGVGCYVDYGTDGGTHNFIRMLEGGGGALNYRGSIVSLYYNRQATGIYKCCSNVYSPPARNYAFDTDFLDPLLLPPKTPMFRDINALGFVQVTRRQ